MVVVPFLTIFVPSFVIVSVVPSLYSVTESPFSLTVDDLTFDDSDDNLFKKENRAVFSALIPSPSKYLPASFLDNFSSRPCLASSATCF